ncbi:MAG: hypothetical protein R6V38_01740 [Roseovarius gahaiensis]
MASYQFHDHHEWFSGGGLWQLWLRDRILKTSHDARVLSKNVSAYR